jgi:extradiol dioxygenase family protein
MSQPLFHLSIPAVDLEATKQWYVEGLVVALVAAASMP